MPELTVVYWRDIPAQVIVGKGRKSTRLQLPERFEKAIDRCAMKIGAVGTDAYLAEWRRSTPRTVDGTPQEVAAREAARIDADFDVGRIRDLIGNDGWENTTK